MAAAAAAAAASPAALEIKSSLRNAVRSRRLLALHGYEDPAAGLLAGKIGHVDQDPGWSALVDDYLENRIPGT